LRKLYSIEHTIDRTGGVSNIHTLKIADDDYPQRLREISCPPVTLYIEGGLLRSFSKERRRAVGIVGSRRCSAYGRDMAARLGEDLSQEGITIVSGLAEGIDASAHWGALKGQGGTIAVLGCGLDIVYPKVNQVLYTKIKETGSVITEFEPGTLPFHQNFPARNRIISGLSDLIIVVEGAERSGALITADFALEQGKEVMAVPGRADTRFCKAPHKLLRSGAGLVETSQDVLEELGMDSHSKPKRSGNIPQLEALTDEETQVYRILAEDSQNIDEIIMNTGLQTHIVSSILVILELKRLIIKGLDSKYHVCS